MTKVQVVKGDSVINFIFKEMCDALEFASTCLECCDNQKDVMVCVSIDEEL